jgi:hypothetical protein
VHLCSVRLPAAILDIAKRLILDNRRNPASAGLEKEGGWLLIASVITSMRKEVRNKTQSTTQNFELYNASIWFLLNEGRGEAENRT